MADLDRALIGYLRNQTALTNLIGDEFYALHAPQTAANDFIVYIHDEREEVWHLGGYSSLAKEFYIFEIHIKGHSNYAKLTNVAQALRAALRNFTGVQGGVTVRYTMTGNSKSLDDPDPDIIGLSLEVTIMYKDN